ncbi:Sodium/calcium exchanger protein-domain-containing protein [Lipomyces chichibuensis]|uniref:Sodium/calcium exchanger protein-domain-containing protein n=1 Tax=Lipomyces chichibuensis TaxID=1546026 RepID=UPI0033433322
MFAFSLPRQALHLALPCILLIMALSACVHAESAVSGGSDETRLPSSPILKMRYTPYQLLTFKTAADGLECSDVLKAKNKCAFVKQYCADDRLGLFNYLELYYCTFADAKPIALGIITVWLVAVFTTIGITASDFLCPNLNTISDLLGMSESLAGVTFLALGNGSPDVFSTYAAMKSGSGSLAVGELIGAASFITSVVAGSMAIICPFTVNWGSFLRELGFFTIAVGFAMYCLQDGRIALWECTAMVVFYLVYVIFVVSWHWWLTRGDRSTSTQIHHADQLATTTDSFGSEQQLAYFANVVDSRGLDEQEVESAPLLGTGPSSSNMDIERAVDRYHLRALQEGTYGEITQTMRLQRPWNNNHSGYGYGESPSLASSVPVRPSLIGALELRSAVQRGRKAMKLDEEAVARHFRNRSVSQGFSRRHKPIHAHRLSVDHIISAGASSRYAYGQENVRGHKFRSHSAIETGDLAYFSEGSRPSSRASSRSPPYFAATFPRPSSSATAQYQGEMGPATLASPSLQPLRSPSVSSPIRQIASQSQSSLTAMPSIFGSRSRSNSLQTERGMSPYGRSGRSKKTHARNTSSISRRSRSTSPFDRFLAFQPPSVLPASSEVPQGVSRISEEDLISFDDRSSCYSDAPASPGVGLLGTPEPHHNETLSNISEADSQMSDVSSRWSIWSCIPHPYDVRKTLFPTIDRLYEKTNLNKFVSIIVVPSVLLLTITVPVVEAERLEDEDNEAFEIPEVHVDGGGNCADDDSPEEADGKVNVMGQTRFKGWNKWLTCVQCLFGPLGILYMNWYDVDNLLQTTVYVTVGSLIALAGLLRFTEIYKPPVKLLPTLCFVGFMVSISWISAIAVEAVGILKAYGVIFGISDAILGLTIFALGNSLGDYVSNITVAKMGYPMMAISACFGSPMLNILIGIGVSGIIILPNSSGYDDDYAYNLEIAPSLIISAATLFLNLLLFLTCVPLSKWRMTRTIGIASVSLWIIGTCINVVLEIVTMSR